MTTRKLNNPAILPPFSDKHKNLARPEVIWLSTMDGAKLGCRTWQGDQNAPVVLYTHGIEGHSQWFENTAGILNKQGINIYAPDRRGAGLNIRMRGHLDNYQTLINDLEEQLRYIAYRHPNSALFLIANCWSAKLAAISAGRSFENKSPDNVPPINLSGLVFVCPAIYTEIDFPFSTKLKIAFDWLQGSYRLMQYWPIPLTTEMLTNNPQYIDFLNEDPLRLTKATSSFFVQTFFASLKAQQSAKFIQTPLLIMQSGNDQIVDIKKLSQWYNRIPAVDKEMRLFPGASHSLDFDSLWFEEYVHMLSEWIISRSK